MLINRLSTLMGARRVSMQDVARATGLNYTTVFQLYHDKSNRFDRQTLDALCKYFGVGLGEILEWQPGEPPAQKGEADGNRTGQPRR